MSHEILDKLIPAPVDKDEPYYSPEDPAYQKRLKAYEHSVRALALEGIQFPEEFKPIAMKVVRGGMTHEQYRAILRKMAEEEIRQSKTVSGC